MVVDIDSSLHQVHSENKEQAAPNYKGGFGFRPIYCFADATGEALAVRLRPGNAGANTIADHVTVLDQAIAQLPAEVAVGHRDGDDPALVCRPLQVRCDSAGCTDFVWRCRDRNVGFAVVADSNASIHAGISHIAADDDAWTPAVRQDGEERPGAAVAELTDLVDLGDSPTGTRLIVRREQLHPGTRHRTLSGPGGASAPGAAAHRRRRQPASPSTYIAALQDQHRSSDRPTNDSGAHRFPFVDVRRRPGLARRGQLRRRPRALVPAALPDRLPRRRRTRRRCAGACGTPPHASCTEPADTSCASSTAGQPPTSSSPPTSASP